MKLQMTFASTDQTLPATFASTDTTTPVHFADMQIVRGATFTPSVSTEGVLSWSNDQGLSNPEAVQVRPVKGVDYYTDADKAEMVSAVKASMVTETWVYTLEDGTVVEKKVLVDA